MESATPHLPAPSTAWSCPVAAPTGEPAGEFGAAPLGPQLREDDAFQLRARLLRLIVDREHHRKAAVLEPFNGR